MFAGCLQGMNLNTQKHCFGNNISIGISIFHATFTNINTEKWQKVFHHEL